MGGTAVAACYVPDDYTTIQAALDNCADDTIIVRDGTYTGAGNKNLDFGGRAITLRSENGAPYCIIDCEGDGRGFYFHSGETSASVVDGFTIQNASTEYTGTFPDGWGAGIYCESSSPTIQSCMILSGYAHSGGGIACYSNASPLIKNCLLELNVAEYGGGFYCNFASFPEITNCSSVGSFALYSGGGIYCANSSWPNIINSNFGAAMAMEGFEIALVQNSSLTIDYSNVHLGQGGSLVEPGSFLYWGTNNFDAQPEFVPGPFGDFYLSQTSAGQAIDSPCIDAGNDTAVNLGLDAFTTRTDQAGDSGVVDIGFHYQIDASGRLIRIIPESPEDSAFPVPPPAFTWTAFGGQFNLFVVDFAFSASGPIVYTTPIMHSTSWQMPLQLWNVIPPGRNIYWRVRGVDLAHRPLEIIQSDDLWYFHGPE